jgi:hypothetical protein
MYNILITNELLYNQFYYFINEPVHVKIYLFLTENYLYIFELKHKILYNPCPIPFKSAS